MFRLGGVACVASYNVERSCSCLCCAICLSTTLPPNILGRAVDSSQVFIQSCIFPAGLSPFNRFVPEPLNDTDESP